MRTHALPGRPLGLATAGLLALALVLPAGALGATTDPDLLATVELATGNVQYPVEVGTMHLFSEAGQSLALQVIDGCDINGHLWLFGAGLSGVSVRATIFDRDSGESASVVLPPYERGEPVGTAFEPEALPLCRDDIESGGLPVLDGRAAFTSADARGVDGTEDVLLVSDGSDSRYRRLLMSGTSFDIIGRGSPIVAIDDSGASDQLLLITESRTPRQLEGISFSGDQGMIRRDQFSRAARGLTKARVRRAYETAKNGRVPANIIEDLGLRGVRQVHHLALAFDTLGADAYLAAADWIREGGAPIAPPEPVAERFTVELVAEDGTREPVPLVGPLVGSDAEGTRWEYASDTALVQIYDACALDGSMWTWAGALADAPLELVITDTLSGESASTEVWTDRRDVSRMADTTLLAACD